jgi:hypothetical protein
MHLEILALLVLFAGALHLAAAVPTDANKIVSIFVGLKQQNIDRLHVRLLIEQTRYGILMPLIV